MDSVFEKIRTIGQSIVERNLERISKIKRHKEDILNEKNREVIDLKGYAAECQKLFNDPKYRFTSQFLDKCESDLTKSLVNLSVSVNSKEELLLETVRIGAQIQLLRLIKNKPYKIIEQCEKLAGEVKV